MAVDHNILLAGSGQSRIRFSPLEQMKKRLALQDLFRRQQEAQQTADARRQFADLVGRGEEATPKLVNALASINPEAALRLRVSIEEQAANLAARQQTKAKEEEANLGDYLSAISAGAYTPQNIESDMQHFSPQQRMLLGDLFVAADPVDLRARAGALRNVLLSPSERLRQEQNESTRREKIDSYWRQSFDLDSRTPQSVAAWEKTRSAENRWMGDPSVLRTDEPKLRSKAQSVSVGIKPEQELGWVERAYDNYTKKAAPYEDAMRFALQAQQLLKSNDAKQYEAAAQAVLRTMTANDEPSQRAIERIKGGHDIITRLKGGASQFAFGKTVEEQRAGMQRVLDALVNANRAGWTNMRRQQESRAKHLSERFRMQVTPTDILGEDTLFQDYDESKKPKTQAKPSAAPAKPAGAPSKRDLWR